jgi:hypothetical protein
MVTEITVKIRDVRIDGYPDMDKLTGQVLFIFDGNIVPGWPLDEGEEDGLRYWEGNDDVSYIRQAWPVTHWIELPVPMWEMESLKNPMSGAECD